MSSYGTEEERQTQRRSRGGRGAATRPGAPGATGSWGRRGRGQLEPGAWPCRPRRPALVSGAAKEQTSSVPSHPDCVVCHSRSGQVSCLLRPRHPRGSQCLSGREVAPDFSCWASGTPSPHPPPREAHSPTAAALYLFPAKHASGETGVAVSGASGGSPPSAPGLAAPCQGRAERGPPEPLSAGGEPHLGCSG